MEYMNKLLVIGVLFLLISSSCISISGFNTEQLVKPVSSGNTLYVGGSGPNNYTKIQDAIDDAYDGDRVFVYDDSSPYYENVIIEKSINLIGENRNTTIIDGNGCIGVSSDGVNISKFTILYDIFLYYCSKNTISDNIIYGKSWIAIELSYSCNNLISNNEILDGTHRIELLHSSNNIIKGNKICNGSNTTLGISINFKSNNNSIIGNEISNCIFGLMIGLSRNNIIQKNNFIGNRRQAIFVHFWRDIFNENYWDSNYWDKHTGSRPKIIIGRIGYLGFTPWINLDRNPASEPYDI